MDLLDLPQLAERAALPLSLTRYYRDRFILFVPSVRIGRTILHPVEAADVILTIHEQAAAGLSAEAIQAFLGEAYPVTVISSQELPRGDAEADGDAITTKIASIDERGARIESEVAKLREQVAGVATAAQVHSALFETQVVAVSRSEEHMEELQRVRSAIQELRGQIALLASREQLEWIGDVVAAAALQPPKEAMDDVIERHLIELRDEVRLSNGNAEIANLRATIERLTQHTGNRDQDVHRAFQTLIDALRAEIATLHARLADLKTAARIDGVMRAGDAGFSASADGERAATSSERIGADRPPERGKPRSPRRLGQPLRHTAPVEHYLHGVE